MRDEEVVACAAPDGGVSSRSIQRVSALGARQRDIARREAGVDHVDAAEVLIRVLPAFRSPAEVDDDIVARCDVERVSLVAAEEEVDIVRVREGVDGIRVADLRRVLVLAVRRELVLRICLDRLGSRRARNRELLARCRRVAVERDREARTIARNALELVRREEVELILVGVIARDRVAAFRSLSRPSSPE